MEESISVIQKLAEYSCIFLVIFNNIPPLFSPSPDQRNAIFKSFYVTANSEAAKEKIKNQGKTFIPFHISFFDSSGNPVLKSPSFRCSTLYRSIFGLVCKKRIFFVVVIGLDPTCTNIKIWYLIQSRC